MRITSSAFNYNTKIPGVYTCDAKNVCPQLSFTELPTTAYSLVLIVSDPDSVNKTPFYHFVLYNIDPNITQIDQKSDLSKFGVLKNDFGNLKYEGPCPPKDTGTHRYLFDLYALDGKLELNSNSTVDDLIKAMQTHIVDTAQLIGLYSKE